MLGPALIAVTAGWLAVQINTKDAALSSPARTLPSTHRIAIRRPAPAPPTPPHQPWVTYDACGNKRANVATTNLRPRVLPASLPTQYDLDFQAGTMTTEHATDLVLRDGLIGAGNGAEAAYPHGLARVRVGPAAPVKVPVTVAVLNSHRSGRRVAFVELHIGADAPVQWTEETSLFIGTDGGDGGFATSSAMVPSFPQNADSFLDAFYTNGDSISSIVCVVRHSDDKPADGVVFDIGYGDGGYPTLLGWSAEGRIVSVVSYGFVVPWALSGLPGVPPREVVDETRRRATAKR